jgi:hypothetical protein
MMTAVPLTMFIVFMIWMAGGPKQSLAWLEGVLRSLAGWVSDAVR